MSVKFKVFKAGDELEKIVYWDMCEISDGGIRLIARNDQGHKLSNVVDICPDGTLFKCHSVDKDLGLQLDEKGRIIERSS